MQEQRYANSANQVKQLKPWKQIWPFWRYVVSLVTAMDMASHMASHIGLEWSPVVSRLGSHERGVDCRHLALFCTVWFGIGIDCWCMLDGSSCLTSYNILAQKGQARFTAALTHECLQVYLARPDCGKQCHSKTAQMFAILSPTCTSAERTTSCKKR